MDEIFELKLRIFSGIHAIIDRALYLEQAVEGLIGVLAQVVPQSTTAVILKDGEMHYFVTPQPDDSRGETERRVRRLYKTGFDMVFSIPQPFVVIGDDNPKPLFLDRKALHSIEKEQVRLFGCPIVVGDEVLGAIMADRIFGDQVPVFEDVQFLSILASFIAQVFSLASQAKRREEALAKENLILRAKISEEHLGLICQGKSDAARRLEAEIRKAAPAGVPVLLCGEPGTGKSSIARIVHELSDRARFPFVKVNCSLPEDLLEKELFDREKGYLSRGAEQRLTAFDKAAGGTVLLDDVGNLSLPQQAKLLDILDGLHPMGAGVERPTGIDVRLVAVAGTDLFDAASAGSLRKDLLNRLGTLLIHVPSIRERKEDVPFLIRHFLATASREQGKRVQLSGRVFKMLCEYDWPGNIAELKNAVIRLVIMADGSEIAAEDFDTVLYSKRPVLGSTGVIRTLSRLDQIERKEVSAALERNRWIRRKAANDLGLTFRQMNYRVKKFGLDTLIRENRARNRD
jgi:Nif-specific regulatory protein